MRIDPEFTNEEVFEDALAHGLTPEDASCESYAEAFGEYIAQKEIIQSRKTTGA